MVDHARVEAAVREILLAVGEDPDRDGLRDTPGRVARSYEELFSGLSTDPAELLATTFDIQHEELVLVRDVEMTSCCEHHLLPFKGVAHIGVILAPISVLLALAYADRPLAEAMAPVWSHQIYYG